MPFSARVFGIHQRESHKRPAVAVPGGQHRQGTELRGGLQVFQDWSLSDILHADFQAVEKKLSIFPQLAGRQRHYRRGRAAGAGHEGRERQMNASGERGNGL